MQDKQNGRKAWWYILPVVAILLLVGAAAFSLRGSAPASTSEARAPMPQVNRPAGMPASEAAAQPAAQIKEKRYPNGVRVVESVAHDTSPPLRDMPFVEPVVGRTEDSDEANENPDPAGMGPSLRDTVVQNTFGPLVMPTPIVNFDGIDQSQSFCGCLPPDTNGDVGPNHYVQWNNTAYRIWDKLGNPLIPARPGNSLFTGLPGRCASTNSGDPIALYDPLADRWFLSQFISSAPYGMCIAVSATPDPTGAYHRYEFILSNSDFYDYEKYGVWPDGYYFTANVFTGAGGFYPAAGVFERDRMLQGQVARYIEINPGNYYASLLPSDLDGTTPPPAGSPAYFASTSGSSTDFHLWRWYTDWANPSNTRMEEPIDIPVATLDPNMCNGSRNCIPQPGTTVRLDSLNNRLMYRLAYRNMGTHEVLLSNQTVDENGQDHAGIRWYEIRDLSTNPYIYQQGTYAPDAHHRWMGSIAMDRSGNIAMGFTVSSSTVFPSVRYAGRLASDPLGQMAQGEEVLIAGTGSQTHGSGRWGDYSNISVDPTDDCTFWVTNEYYATTSNSSWRTRIGSFRFPGCGQPQPTPTGTPPTPRPTNTIAPPTPTPCSNYSATTSTGVFTPITGTSINNCDDCTTYITLPFPVQIYEQMFTNAYISSNGTIQFGSSDSAFGSDCLPVFIFRYADIPFWADLYTGDTTTQGVFTQVTGNAPTRVFHVQWRANTCCTNGAALNFESRFHEGSNRVDHLYGPMANTGSIAATGIQRDRDTAFQYSCFQGSITPGLLVTFNAPACPVQTATPVATNTVVPPTTTNTVVVNTPTNTVGVSTPTTTAVANTPTNTVMPTATACTISFRDVPSGHTFHGDIRCLACRGIISGYADGTFRPDNLVTRGQLAKIVSNAANFTESPGAQIFQDVPPDHAFYEWINRLTRRGYMTGYSCGTVPGEPCVQNRPYFRPFANATRAQTAKIVSNAAMIVDPPTGQTFEDVPPSHAFYEWIQRLATRQVMGGYECGRPGEPCMPPGNRPYFRPFNDVTRGQSAKIVANTFYPNCRTP